MNLRNLLTIALLPASLMMSAPLIAGEGHDHGDSGPATNANGPQRQPDGSVFCRNRRNDNSACAPCWQQRRICRALWNWPERS